MSSREYYQYTLNQTGCKKYVGITSNLDRRLVSPFSGTGSKWTQKFRPTSVAEINYVGNYQDAKRAETTHKKIYRFFYVLLSHKSKIYNFYFYDKTTKYYEYKNKYGINNVRGSGNTSSVNIQTCYKCGREGQMLGKT
jgi:predicted GIY-YIG superfamily endonuclease